jgi:hypothetical protein
MQGDELWTRLSSRLDLREVWTFLVRDGKHPPLYTILSRLLASVTPDAPLALRTISIVSVAGIPSLLFAFGRRLDVPVIPAIALCAWVTLHPLLGQQAVNARPYAMLCVLVAVHAVSVLDYLLFAERPALLIIGLSATAAILTHAFGTVYVGCTLACAGYWMVCERRNPGRARVDRLIVAHAPAAIACLSWYGYVAITLRGTQSVAGGLNWVELPSLTERAYTLGTLLGSVNTPRSTTLTLCLWTIIMSASCWLLPSWSARRTAAAATTLGIFGAFLAQNLASGLILKLPLWGNRHVAPTPSLLVIALFVGLVLLRRNLVWGRAVTMAVSCLTLFSLSAVPQWRRTMLSATAERVRNMQPTPEVRVTYRYGDLNILNYYLNRACLDDFQFRVQFPDVLGPADASLRASSCVAKPVDVAVDSGRSVLVVYRTFVVSEVAQRDSLFGIGWTLRAHVTDANEKLAVDWMTRTSAPEAALGRSPAKSSPD